MFRLLSDPAPDGVMLSLDGRSVLVPPGISLAAAALIAGLLPTRRTAVSGAPRAPYCMIGVCYDCLMEVDGVANVQACLTPVRPGMAACTQRGLDAAGHV